MNVCFRCRSVLVETCLSDEIHVGDLVFHGAVPCSHCSRCNESFVSADALQAFEIRVARRLTEAGIFTPESFRFRRKALGLRAVELAELLGVCAETVSRWETGKRPVDRATMTVLAVMVADWERKQPAALQVLLAQQATAVQSSGGPGRFEV